MTRFDTDTPWDIKTYPKHSSFFTIWLVYSSMYTSMWMCSLNVFLFRKDKDVALFSACIPKHMRSFAASLSRMPSSSMGSNGWCHDVMPHFPPFPPNSPGLVKAAKQKKGERTMIRGYEAHHCTLRFPWWLLLIMLVVFPMRGLWLVERCP